MTQTGFRKFNHIPLFGTFTVDKNWPLPLPYSDAVTVKFNDNWTLPFIHPTVVWTDETYDITLFNFQYTFTDVFVTLDGLSRIKTRKDANQQIVSQTLELVVSHDSNGITIDEYDITGDIVYKVHIGRWVYNVNYPDPVTDALRSIAQWTCAFVSSAGGSSPSV